ncbi:MAG: zinc ABC transporter substrate-binding protein [Thermoleophilia bacterium]|nr:zinc ABC transporter substrate-binding protein [Thermoleophilia bacterium]
MVLTFVLAGVLAGCGGSEAAGDDRREVVAAFYPLAFAAAQVGGNAVAVENVTPAGAEPHDAELSARTVERLRGADVVLYLGDGFQPAVERAVAGARGEAVDLLDAVAVRRADGAESDPHVGLDPRRFAAIVERVGEVLGAPARAERLQERLRGLDRELALGLGSCRRRHIVTGHAAFGYLADRYGLEQVALSGVSPEAEPAPRELARLAAEVRRLRATTVFVETLASPRIAETIARETGARTATLNPIEGLTPAEQARGENYFSLMRANLGALRKALGCR